MGGGNERSLLQTRTPTCDNTSALFNNLITWLGKVILATDCYVTIRKFVQTRLRDFDDFHVSVCVIIIKLFERLRDNQDVPEDVRDTVDKKLIA